MIKKKIKKNKSIKKEININIRRKKRRKAEDVNIL